MWSNYTLNLLMDVYEIQSLVDNNKYYMNESVLNFVILNVCKLFLNITIQNVRHHFNHGLRSTFFEFKPNIDDIFREINAYILQFTTRSDTLTKLDKRCIFGAAFMVMYGLVTAYTIYKSYTSRKNVQHTLSYILSNQRYLHRLMHTSADSIFYKNYILHYVNILHHLFHDLVIHNNKIECIKSNLHMKCRNFITGLHILGRNSIPESILHADVFSNILHGVSQYLLKDNVYTLLYGTTVNPY